MNKKFVYLFYLFTVWLNVVIVWYKDCLFRFEAGFLFLLKEYVLVKDFCAYFFVDREQEVKSRKMTDLLNFFVQACYNFYVKLKEGSNAH